MKIENLNTQELEQLQTLLNKMNPVTETNLVDEMIDEIMNEFNFAKVADTMAYLDWKWIGKVVTIEMLKEKAIYLLKESAKNRLGVFINDNWELYSSIYTGGLKAIAYCNEEKTKIECLELQFILESCETEND